MTKTTTLDALPGGETAEVVDVGGAGAMHARLRDLGFVKHSRVTCLFASAFGGPRAYRVRDTVVALRGCDARQVRLELPGGER